MTPSRARGLIREHDEVGEAGFAQHLDRQGRARHLHQREDALLHPRDAGRVTMIIAALRLTAASARK